MEQLILHLFGDYITQSHWMAQNKAKRFYPAAVHALIYSLPFLILSPSLAAFSVILVTHFLIDRYRLARFVVWFKNSILSPWWGLEQSDDWVDCRSTGYPKDVPAWMSVWLLIAADNTLHLAINYSALRWL